MMNYILSGHKITHSVIIPALFPPQYITESNVRYSTEELFQCLRKTIEKIAQMPIKSG